MPGISGAGSLMRDVRGTMRAILKCIHPLVPVSVGIFVCLLAVLPGPLKLQDILPLPQPAGPCSGLPLFLAFLPGEFMLLLGLGFSGVRLFQLRCQRREARERGQS
jgi:hypothetical protein